MQNTNDRTVTVLGLTLLNRLAMGLTQFVSVSFFVFSNTYHHYAILNILPIHLLFNRPNNINDAATSKSPRPVMQNVAI